MNNILCMYIHVFMKYCFIDGSTFVDGILWVDIN